MENNRFGKSGVKNKTRRAFTITELVIVIAVIAILAAVLIPTFSSVIKNSKKSHDEQYVKEINVALSAYKGETGMAPEDYEGLMLVLKDYGLTDESNPFLLATALKQENAYIVWYPNANSVMLISEDTDNLMVTFTSSIGLGNGVFVLDSLGNTSTLGYALCTNGEYTAIAPPAWCLAIKIPSKTLNPSCAVRYSLLKRNPGSTTGCALSAGVPWSKIKNIFISARTAAPYIRSLKKISYGSTVSACSAKKIFKVKAVKID